MGSYLGMFLHLVDLEGSLPLGWEAASEFMASTNPTAESPMFEQVLNWIPPPMDMIAINCDGSWDISGLGGKGVVIRNHLGLFMGGLATPVRATSVEVVEVLAILAGVNLAVDMNLKAVQVQSDSQSVISYLNSMATCNNWRTNLTVEEIKWKSRFFDRVHWRWIPREANSAAHTAAQLGKQALGLCIWSETPPPSLTMVLRNDRLPCPHDDVN
ncbi:hypothetical protein ACLB2K_038723 [Fragaria x ananassa]